MMLQRMLAGAGGGSGAGGGAPVAFRGSMTCTPEQQALVDLPIVPGRCVIVDAVPGAGKTSTCLERDIRLGGCRRVMFMFTLNATDLAIRHSADRKFAITATGVRSATSWLAMLEHPRRLYTVAAVARQLVAGTTPPAPDEHTAHLRLDSFVDAVMPLVECLRLCPKTKGIPKPPPPPSSFRGGRHRPPPVTLADVFEDRKQCVNIYKGRIRRWTSQFDGTPATSFAAVVAWPCGWHALAVQWFYIKYGIEASAPTADMPPLFYKNILNWWKRYAKEVVAPLMAVWGFGAVESAVAPGGPAGLSSSSGPAVTGLAFLPALPGDTAEAATEFLENVVEEIATGRLGDACAEIRAAPRTYTMTVFDFAATVVASRGLQQNLFNVSETFFDFYTLKVSWFPEAVQWDLFRHVDEVIVDEAADISLHQREILHKFLAQGKQVVAMGDRHQQICQFSGTNNFVADPGCDPATTTTLRMQLSISFRLPAVVRNMAYLVGNQAPGSRIRLACECPEEAPGVEPRPGSVVITRAALQDVIGPLARRAAAGGAAALAAAAATAASTAAPPAHTAVIVRSNAAVAAAVEAVCKHTDDHCVLLTAQMFIDFLKALHPANKDEAEQRLEAWKGTNDPESADVHDTDNDDRWVKFYEHIKASKRADKWNSWVDNKITQRVFKDSEGPPGVPAIFVGNQYSVKGGEWETVVVGSDVVNWRVPAAAKSEADRNLEYVALTRSYATQLVLLDVGTRREDVHASYRSVVDAHLDHTGYAGGPGGPGGAGRPGGAGGPAGTP
jgi:hypothetical protein